MWICISTIDLTVAMLVCLSWRTAPPFVVLERLLKTYRKDLHHVDLWVRKAHASIACHALWFSIAQLQSWAFQSKYLPADFERTEFNSSCFWKYLLLFFFFQRNRYYWNTVMCVFWGIYLFYLAIYLSRLLYRKISSANWCYQSGMSTSKEPHVIFYFFVFTGYVISYTNCKDIWVLKVSLPICKYTADYSQQYIFKK